MMRALIADDDPIATTILSRAMARWQFDITVAADGEAAWTAIQTHATHFAIVDWMMPALDGPALCRRIRADASTAHMYVVLLTSRDSRADLIVGLDSGADDYLVKPFSPRELLARIRAVLRRYEGGQPEAGGENIRRESELRTYRFAGWELATGSRRLVSPTGDRVELTNSEYALLVSFLKSPLRVLSRDQLLEGSRLHDDIYDRSIDVQILRLRRKIEADPNEPKLIRTERGAGYFFDAKVVVI